MKSRILLLLALIVVAACARVVRLDDVGIPEIVAEEYDVAQWASYREYLEKIEQGASCQQSEFDHAINFFESVTSLKSGLTAAYGGRVLDRAQLREALGRWDRWYAGQDLSRRRWTTPGTVTEAAVISARLRLTV